MGVRLLSAAWPWRPAVRRNAVAKCILIALSRMRLMTCPGIDSVIVAHRRALLSSAEGKWKNGGETPAVLLMMSP